MQLNWRVLPYPKEKFLVKGTELAQALAGPESRYAIIEVRTWDGKNSDIMFRVRDAALINDADIAMGKRPPVVFESSNWEAVEKYFEQNAK